MKIFSLLKRVPKVKILIPLILIAGFSEAVGLAILIPIVSTLTNESQNNSLPGIFKYFEEILQIFPTDKQFIVLLGFALFFMILSYFLIYIQEKTVFKSRFRLLKDLRNNLTKSIVRSKWERISELSSGDISNSIIRESERGAEALLGLVMIMASIFQITIYSVFAISLSWKIFLTIMLIMSVGYFTSRKLIKIARKLGDNSAKKNNELSQFIVDFIRGSKILKATNTFKNPLKKLMKINSDACDLDYKICYNQVKMRFQIQSIISIAIVTILFISVEIIKINSSVLLLFMFVIMRIAPKVSVLQGQYHNFNAYIPILDILDKVIEENRNEIEDIRHNAQNSKKIISGIEIKNITYCYPKEKIKAIDNASMIIPAKSFTAFVGSSGSGKSTFANLLMGLMDADSGEIVLDGVNIKDINRDTYRSRIGFVSQENLFFNDTIKYNLTFGDNYKEENIWEALKAAQIYDHIINSPNKLNTIIGEAGLSLSGGQRQRLSIARSLLRKPNILVLDEASSALDTESENKLQEAIEKIRNNFTLIVVAHRLSTIKNAGKIYVFDKGSIVESGSYNELCDLNGRFAELNNDN